jgi:outer membrane protein assembly factor BamB
MRQHRVVTLGASVLATLALTAGCSSGAEPTAAPQQTAAESAPTSTSSTAPTSQAPAEPPAVGTVLARYTPAGQVTVTANPNGGFAIVDVADGSSQAIFYDAAGRRVGTVSGADFDADCGLGDAGSGDDRVAITEHVDEQDAEGIHAAKYSLQMQAVDVRSGKQLWQQTLIPAQTDQLSCGGDSSDVDTLTTNGKWVLQVPPDAVNEKHPKINVVNTQTGKTRQDMKSVGLLGDYLVDGDPTGNSNTYTLTDPASGKAYGSLPSSQNGNGISFDNSWVLAGSGVASDTGAVVLNTAGDLLMAEVSDSDGSTTVKAYKLPSAKAIWSAAAPDDTTYTLVAAAGGKLLVDESASGGSNQDKLVALDERTGKPLWHVPDGDVCGLTAKQLMLSVNQQLAVIDMQSGKQLSYSGEEGSSCPDIRPGGIAVSNEGDGVTVTQVLAP